jgi:predicted protein tyrosine phosphatase
MDVHRARALRECMINALFICSQNKLRSPTAEAVFATWPGVETDSAGTNNDAETPLTPEHIAWADIIFVMEKTHRTKLSKQFRRHLNGKRAVCLDIPDDFAYMQPELVALLEKKVGAFLR